MHARHGSLFRGCSWMACCLAISLHFAPCWGAVIKNQTRPNVLFVAIDDLRPQLTCYGREQMHSPHLDRLAANGVLFERAYCMVPTCGASRAALMTSIRPSRRRFTTHLTWAEKDAPQAVPLHGWFKQQGYHTVSLGKVFHHREDHRHGWSEPAWRSKQSGYRNAKAMRTALAENRKRWPNKKKHRSAPYEIAVADDDDYPDGQCAGRAIRYLKEFSQQNDDGKPFFLAVGFLKPHLPFCAPKKYWDLYDPAKIELPENYRIPKDVPKQAPHNSGELRAYADIPPTGLVDEQTARKLIHGYYACVSFADAQVGRLLAALKETGLDENTIVVVWGDHGWQLGEHGMWNKHSCFETSLHSPLLIQPPRQAGVQPGTRVSALVEFIDVYPTLCELSGLKIPAHVQGESLVPLMHDPTRPGKGFAISRFGSGDSIRVPTLRYSEYTSTRNQRLGAMLFDHQADPHEDRNIYRSKRSIARQLSQTLNKHKGQDKTKSSDE